MNAAMSPMAMVSMSAGCAPWLLPTRGVGAGLARVRARTTTRWPRHDTPCGRRPDRCRVAGRRLGASRTRPRRPSGRSPPASQGLTLEALDAEDDTGREDPAGTKKIWPNCSPTSWAWRTVGSSPPRTRPIVTKFDPNHHSRMHSHQAAATSTAPFGRSAICEQASRTTENGRLMLMNGIQAPSSAASQPNRGQRATRAGTLATTRAIQTDQTMTPSRNEPDASRSGARRPG